MTKTQHRLRNAGPSITLVIVFTLAMTLLGPSASSHTGLIARTWQRDKQVEFDFTASVGSMPGGSRNAINAGAEDWNALNGSVTLIPGANVANFSPDQCPPTYQQNAMHYDAIDGPSGVLAVATTCRFTSGNELYSMQITFDSGENWYTGTGNPASSQIDMWAVATHEFGHTIGIAHFDAADAVCDGANRETMCPFYAVSQRTPASHDTHGFTAAYGGGPAPGADEAPPEEDPTTQAPPPNEAPEGTNLTVRVRQGSKFGGRLNLTDPEGENVTIQLVGQNFNATKQRFTNTFGSGGNTWSITPSARPGTAMFFTYKACDPENKCSPLLKVTVKVTNP